MNNPTYIFNAGGKKYRVQDRDLDTFARELPNATIERNGETFRAEDFARGDGIHTTRGLVRLPGMGGDNMFPNRIPDTRGVLRESREDMAEANRAIMSGEARPTFMPGVFERNGGYVTSMGSAGSGREAVYDANRGRYVEEVGRLRPQAAEFLEKPVAEVGFKDIEELLNKEDFNDFLFADELVRNIQKQRSSLEHAMETAPKKDFTDLSEGEALALTQYQKNGDIDRANELTTQGYSTYKAASYFLNQARLTAEAGRNNAGALAGLGNSLFDSRTWNPGGAAGDVNELMAAINKYENGLELSPLEQSLLDAAAIKAATEAYYSDKLSGWYKAGEVAGATVPYMLEFALTSGMSSVGAAVKSGISSLAKWAAKRLPNMLVKGAEKVATRIVPPLARGAEKVATRIVPPLARGAAQTATVGLPRVMADAGNRAVGDIKPGMEYEGRENALGFTQALGDAALASFIDNTIEITGVGPLGRVAGKVIGAPVRGLGRVAYKLTPKVGKRIADRVMTRVSDIADTRWAQNFGNFIEKTQWHGTANEFAEEMVAGTLNSLTVGDQTLGEVWSADNMFDTFLGVALMGGTISGVNTIGTIATGSYKVGARERLNLTRFADEADVVFDQNGHLLEWRDLRNSLSFGNMDDVKRIVKDVYNSDSYSQEEKMALLKYAAARVELSAALGVKEGVDDGKDILLNLLSDEYREGLADGSPEGAIAADNELTTAEGRLRQFYNIAPDESVETFLSGYELDEEGQALYDNYRLAKARFEGESDAVNAVIEEDCKRSDDAIDARSNNGNVFSTTLDGEEVFITGGDVVLNEDGTIDYGKSSDILYILQPDGTKKQIPADRLDGEVAGRNADELKMEGRAKIDERWRAEIEAVEAGAQKENGAPTGDNVAPVELPEVPDFFRLGGKNYSVASRNADGSVDVMADGKRETLPAGTDYSSIMPTDKKGDISFTDIPVERTHEYFVQRVTNDRKRAEMIENNRKKAEAERKRFDKEPDAGLDPDKWEEVQQKWEEGKKAAQAKVDYWNEVAKREEDITRSRMKESYESVQPSEVVEMTPDEFIANHLPKITPESFKRETGLSNVEQQKLVGFISNEGVTVEQAAESILENYDSELRGLGFTGDVQDVRNMIIDVLGGGNPRSYAKSGLEQRRAENVDLQRAQMESIAVQLGFKTIDDMVAYEESVLPRIVAEHRDFDETEYYNNLAENYENDTTRESESIGRGGELLQGEQSVPAGGTPVVGQRREGGAVSDDVQGGGQNGVAQEEVPVNELVGNSEQLSSSSEIPNYPTISQTSDQVGDQVAEGDAPGQSGVVDNNSANTLQNGNNELNLQKENESDNESNQNDIPIGGQVSQPVPQGEHGTQTSQVSGAQEVAARLRERIESAQGDSKSGLREVENRVTREFAQENGLWIENETELGTPFPSGDEHNNYIDAENQVVYKVNNRMHTPSILDLLDRIEQHNKYFPDSKYSLVGFTSVSKNGDVLPVFAQDFVSDARMATNEEIDSYMGTLGFTRVGDGRYSNGEVVIKDLKPRNVLADADGDIYVVDAEFEQENAQKSGESAENGGETSEEQRAKRKEESAPEIQEPRSVEEMLDNGDKRITNYNSRDEVATVAIERDGKVVSVDSYDEGVLFEHTEYDGNGKATSVTRYDKSGNVVGTQRYVNGIESKAFVKETMRTAPLRARAEKWMKQTGVPVRLIGIGEDITNSAARRAIEAGEKITGWIDNDEVVLYLPNIRNAKEIDDTFVHEVVAHKGLKALMGKDFDALCDKVWEMMSEEQRAYYLGYPGVNGDTRKAADEYMAHLAEGVDLTDADKTIWNWIVDAVRALLAKSGFKLRNRDIENLIKASYSNLKAESGKREGAAKESDTMMRKKDTNNLVAVHNISEDNLRKVFKMGGLVMPSIAVTDVNLGYSEYGGISLIFDKETINPTDRRNKVYGGDAWTPRFPRMVPKLNGDVVLSVRGKLYELLDENVREIFNVSAEMYPTNIEDTIANNGVAGYYGREYMKIAYLLDNGKRFKVPMKEKDYGSMAEAVVKIAKERGLSLRDIKDGGYEFYEKNPEFVAAVQEAKAEQRLGAVPVEEREALREMLVKNPIRFNLFDTYISQALSLERDLKNGGKKQVVDKVALYDAINKKVKTDNADYNKWVDSLFEGVVEKYGIRNNRDWYTPSGNSRPWEMLYDAATPANILRHMLAENEQGGNGNLFDSNFMGAAAETYKSIEEIREKGKKRLLKVNEKEYDEWTNSVSERMSEIAGEFLSPSQLNDFGSIIDAKIAVTNAVAKDKTAKGIYKEMQKEYPAFTMEHAKRVEDIVKEIQDYAIGYFEAKPQRIVPLNEIRKAVVPSNVSSDIVEGLESNGVEVATYKKGDEQSRKRVLKKVTNDIRFRIANENQDIFVSNAQRAVEGIQQNKATAEQWIAMLKKNGGLKAGEEAWLGLEEWLNEKQGAVTKQEILDFIGENKIQIEEVKYGDDSHGGYEKLDEEILDLWREAEGNAYEKAEKVQNILNERYDGFADAAEIWYDGSLRVKDEGALAEILGEDNPINYTRLEYTTKGLENKREIALVVPTVESWNASDEIHFGDAGNGRAVAWVRFGETTDSEGNRVLVIDEIQSKRHQDGREKGYKDAKLVELDRKLNNNTRSTVEELDEAGRLSKERYDYIINKIGGEAVALDNELTELQQKAKELGTGIRNEDAEKQQIPNLEVGLDGARNVRDYDRVTAGIGGIEERMAKRRTDFDSVSLRMREVNTRLDELINNYVRSQRGAVDAAPFEKNWHELAMKRMLRLAAEEGFDKVAWTTGEQQAERYDMRKQVGSIEVRRDNGEYNVFTYNTHGGLIYEATATMTPEQISETFGKELGGKILAVESGKRETITGENLSFGGEGMKGFYDRMLPSFVSKYTKKWGAKVGEVTMPSLEENNTMWSVDVTPEMQESVMQGQTMFRMVAYDKAVQIADNFANTHKGATKRVVISKGKEALEQQMRDAGFTDFSIEVALKNYEGKENPTDGAYYVSSDGIVIYDAENLNATLWHENAHRAIHRLLGDNLSELQRAFDNLPKVLKDRTVAFLEAKGYTPEEFPEEAVAFFIEGAYTDGVFNDGIYDITRFFKGVDDNVGVFYNFVQNVINNIEYEREETDNSGIYLGESTQQQLPERNGESYENGTGADATEGATEPYSDGRESTRFRTTEEVIDRQEENEADIARFDVSSLGERLNIPVRVAEAVPENRRNRKGWLDNGVVTVALQNVASAEEATQTVIHEAVAHRGLSGILGERFNEMLDGVYKGATPSVKRAINDRFFEAIRNGRAITMREATERVIADSEVPGVKELLRGVVRDVTGVELPDGELRYLLWKNVHRGADGVIETILDRAKEAETGTGGVWSLVRIQSSRQKRYQLWYRFLYFIVSAVINKPDNLSFSYFFSKFANNCIIYCYGRRLFAF